MRSKLRIFYCLLLLGLLPAVSGCGLFAGLGEDTPFTFSDADVVKDVGDTGSGTGSADGATDLCVDVTCNSNEECNPADGTCQSITPTPTCTQDSDCADSGGQNQICTSGECVVGCRDDVDCGQDETCDVVTETCKLEICPGVGPCGADQFLNTQDCICEDVPTGDACVLQWQVGTQAQQNTGLKLYIDAESSNSDLPNACDAEEENLEFGCTVDQSQETDPALLIECNKKNEQSRDECLGRSNVPVIPFATRGGQSVTLYLKPDDALDPNGGGSIFIRASEFPQFLIYNQSPNLPANLMIDAGRGELMAPGISMPEIIGEGRYSVDAEGRIAITALPLHFRVLNIVKKPEGRAYDHSEPAPSVMLNAISDFNNSLFSSDPLNYSLITSLAASGLECPTSGVRGVSILPDLNEQALLLTSGASTDAQPSAALEQSTPNAAAEISLNGCPIGPASECDCTLGPNGELPPNAACGANPASNPDEPWLRLVTGLSMPDGTCLLGIGGASLGAEIEGPIRNADGSAFTDLPTACGIQGGGSTGGGSTGGGTGGGDFDLVVKQGDDILPLDEPNPGLFEADVVLQDIPFYKEDQDLTISDSTLLSRFESLTSVTVSNQGSGDTADFDLRSSSGAFRVVGADLLNGTRLNPTEQKTFQVVFAPEEPMPADCQVDSGDPDQWICTADINVFADGSLTVVATATARRPTAEVRIFEVGAVAGDNFNLLLPPQLIPGDGAVDYGVIPVGTYVIKAYELANAGVRDLTIDGIQSQDPTLNFLGGVIRHGSSLASSVIGRGLLPHIIPYDGSDNIYFYEIYWPTGSIGSQASDCDGKPCRADGASVVIQTSEGARALLLTGHMTEDVAARLAVYIEDPVLTNDQIPDNPYLVDCSNLPDNVICVEGNTKAAVRVDPDEGFSGFRQDGTPRGVYLVNGNPSFSADDLQVAATDISFSANSGTWDDSAFLPDDVFNGADCLNIAAGAEPVLIGQLAYVPDSSANVLTQESARLEVRAASVNKGAACGASSNIDPLDGQLFGVSGAPNGRRTLRILRMMAGLDPALPDTHRTKLVSTVTPGQADRADLHDFDRFNIPAEFDPVNGVITLPGVFTPLDGSRGIKLYNPAASGPGAGGIWLFNDHCQIDPGLGCSDFFVYISKNKQSFTQENPAPPIYTDYIPQDALALKAKNPATTNFESELGSLVGMFDPASGRIQFRPEVAVRLFMNPATGILNGQVDGAFISTLTTECITDNLLADPTLNTSVPDKLLGKVYADAATENAPWDNVSKNELFGPNPLGLHQEANNDCPDGPHQLRGRRMGTDDTAGNLDSQTLPSGITFDLAAIGLYKHNSTQLGVPPTMYIVIKACLENQPGDGSCEIN